MSMLYLCGFMGCGKTTVGKKLAEIMGYDFIDLDEYIEKKAGMKISEIFAEYGEDFFRDKENDALKEITGEKIVVSTGGGAMTFKRNADVASSKGKIVFIDTPFEDCYRRIKNDPNRPKVTANSYNELINLFEKRKPHYNSSSDFAVNGHKSVMEIVNNILILLK